MELEGRKELVDTGKSRGTTFSLCLAGLNVFQGFFLAQKWLFLALNCSF